MRERAAATVLIPQEVINDVLIFEKSAGEAEELLLEVKSNHRVSKEGRWAAPKKRSSFRFRIPRSVWQNFDFSKQYDWTTVGPSPWVESKGCAVRVTSVKLAPITLRTLTNENRSAKKFLVVRTQFRVTDPKLKVSYSAFQRGGPSLLGPNSFLCNKKGAHFNVVSPSGMMTTVVGTARPNIILTANDSPAEDLVAFETKASAATDLYLELTANIQMPDPQHEGKFIHVPRSERPVFRFHIPRSAWQN